ncbi:hypothetical protein QTN25_008026 [Entamoeba marina]
MKRSQVDQSVRSAIIIHCPVVRTICNLCMINSSWMQAVVTSHENPVLQENQLITPFFEYFRPYIEWKRLLELLPGLDKLTIPAKYFEALHSKINANQLILTVNFNSLYQLDGFCENVIELSINNISSTCYDLSPFKNLKKCKMTFARSKAFRPSLQRATTAEWQYITKTQPLEHLQIENHFIVDSSFIRDINSYLVKKLVVITSGAVIKVLRNEVPLLSNKVTLCSIEWCPDLGEEVICLSETKTINSSKKIDMLMRLYYPINIKFMHEEESDKEENVISGVIHEENGFQYPETAQSLNNPEPIDSKVYTEVERSESRNYVDVETETEDTQASIKQLKARCVDLTKYNQLVSIVNRSNKILLYPTNFFNVNGGWCSPYATDINIVDGPNEISLPSTITTLKVEESQLNINQLPNSLVSLNITYGCVWNCSNFPLQHLTIMESDVSPVVFDSLSLLKNLSLQTCEVPTIITLPISLEKLSIVLCNKKEKGDGEYIELKGCEHLKTFHFFDSNFFVNPPTTVTKLGTTFVSNEFFSYLPNLEQLLLCKVPASDVEFPKKLQKIRIQGRSCVIPHKHTLWFDFKKLNELYMIEIANFNATITIPKQLRILSIEKCVPILSDIKETDLWELNYYSGEKCGLGCLSQNLNSFKRFQELNELPKTIQKEFIV